MLESVKGSAGEEYDDIEWELCCSSREASISCVPVADVHPWGGAGTLREGHEQEGGGASGRIRLYKAPR